MMDHVLCIRQCFHLNKENKLKQNDNHWLLVLFHVQDKKFERFRHLEKPINSDITQYIRPLNKYNKQYGWYVYIERKKADFGGKHISLEISRQRAEEFIKQIQEYYNAKHQDAESP